MDPRPWTQHHHRYDLNNRTPLTYKTYHIPHSITITFVLLGRLVEKYELRSNQIEPTPFLNLPHNHHTTATRTIEEPPSFTMVNPRLRNTDAPSYVQTESEEPAPPRSFTRNQRHHSRPGSSYYNPLTNKGLVSAANILDSGDVNYVGLLQNHIDNLSVQRETFFKTLPPRIRLIIETPFGKPSLNHSFTQQASLRLVLLPLFHSEFLGAADYIRLATATPHAKQCLKLLFEYGHIDPTPIRGFSSDWQSETTMDQYRIDCTTALLLHYDGDLAAAIRFIGGVHTGAHRDVPATLAYLEDKGLPAQVLQDLTRVWKVGSPAICKGESTAANYMKYRQYGNHKSVYEKPDKTLKALVKDHSRGFTLAIHEPMIDFVLNAHVTPQGLVNIHHERKKDRPVFDSSFHPDVHCFAINDANHKDNEPTIVFQHSFPKFLSSLYNLRISHPDQEIFLADDDIASAFRHIKYHPDIVATRGQVLHGYGVFNSGETFGDNTSPSNAEPAFRARSYLARWLFSHGPSNEELEKLVDPWIPDLKLAPELTEADKALLQRLDPDTHHPGVFRDEDQGKYGNRTSPGFNMYVDDCMMAEIREHIRRAVRCSILACWKIFGHPSDTRVPPSISLDKLEPLYTHLRTIIGIEVDTRAMTVGLSREKREDLASAIDAWLIPSNKFSLRQTAELHGRLEDATRYHGSMRPYFIVIQELLRRAIKHESKQHEGLHKRLRDGMPKQTEIPDALYQRYQALIDRKYAQTIWNSKRQIPTNPNLRDDLTFFQDRLRSPTYNWSSPIAHFVQRDPTISWAGDACHSGLGGHSPTLQVVFAMLWHDDYYARCQIKDSSNPRYLHINTLEWATAILQLAITIAALEAPEEVPALARLGHFHYPVVHVLSDNTSTVQWMARIANKTRYGPNLAKVLGALLERSNVKLECTHIAGKDNDIADHLSRPSSNEQSNFTRFLYQTTMIYPQIGTYQLFLPDAGLISVLTSSFATATLKGPVVLPKTLGRFVPVSSISSCFSRERGSSSKHTPWSVIGSSKRGPPPLSKPCSKPMCSS